MSFLLRTQSLAFGKKHYDAVFDAARGWGCFVVFLYHSNLVQASEYKNAFLNATAIALPIFFIFSAYILIGANLERGGFSYKSAISFYITRFFRIFPTWWIYLFLASLFYNPELKHIFANAFMYFGFGYWDEKFNFTVVGWSLFVEEFFYWFFPIWVLTLNTYKRAIIAFVTAFSVFFLWRVLASQNPLPNNPFWYNQFPLNFMHIFCLGILIHHFWKTDLSKLLENKTVVRCLDVVLIVSAILLPLSLLYFVPVGLFLILLKAKHSLLRKFLLSKASAPMQSVGIFCFSFYLYHALVIGWTGKLIPYLISEPVLKLAIDFMLTWLIAKVSYELIEKPTHVLGYKIASRYMNAKKS